MTEFEKLLEELFGETADEKKQDEDKKTGKKISVTLSYPENEEWLAKLEGEMPELKSDKYHDYAAEGVATLVAGARRMSEATGINPEKFTSKVTEFAVKLLIKMGLESIFDEI